MFNSNFNSNFQNDPNQLANYDPYAQSAPMNNSLNYGQQSDMGFSQYMDPNQMTPPMPQEQMMTPQPMAGAPSEGALFPFQSQNSGTNINGASGVQSYAHGGRVPSRTRYSRLAEVLQSKGEGKDKILAHINPEEAELLDQMSGSDINPHTGLRQFGLFNRPGKWLKSVVGGGAGAILGNVLLPGVGGIIGGALGGALGSKIRGRNDWGQAALRGAATGAILPSAASALGYGANAVGANGAGNFLSNYGSTNAILPSLGLGEMGSSPYASGATALSSLGGANQSVAAPQQQTQAAPPDNRSFLSKLGSNSKDFFTDPQNLLTVGSTAAAYLGRPKEKKEKSPEQIADEQKRLARALRLSPSEFAEREASDLAEEHSRRRVARNKFLPEDRFGGGRTLYRKTHTPGEYAQNGGSWLSYYDNPEFNGAPVPFKRGGMVDHAEQMEPRQYGMVDFLQGNSGGQDDDRPRDIPEGSYIIDASTVSDAGDGNSRAGVDRINALVSDGEMIIPPEKVAQFAMAGAKKLDLFRNNLRKHKRGGAMKLPPKAKSLASYLRG